MAGKPGIYRTRLAGKARVVYPGAAPDPFRAGAAQQRRRNGRRYGGVANPHLAHDQQIGRGIHRVPAGQQGVNRLGLGHRGALGEICRWAIQIQGMHGHRGAKGL